jgi:hypothetical protein
MAHTKVFLTWSGERSNAVARALREWLPLVIQDLHPWMSESDVEKGTRWSTEVAQQLQEAKVGIICLTAENLDEPWINFEAGALSKLTDSYVCTYLFELSPGQVKDPLAQFQATKSEKQLETSFDKWWPDLEARFRQASSMPNKDKRPKRSADDMLEEVLQISRDLTQNDHTIVKGFNTLASAVEKLLDTKPAPVPQTFAQLFGSSPPSVAPGSESATEKIISAIVEANRKQLREKAGKDALPNLRSEGEDPH